MTAPPGSADPFAKVEEDLERQRNLHVQLHGRGEVGKAFAAVREAGCDAQFLENILLNLPHYPQTPSRKIYSSKHRRSMEKIARDLEAAGDRLTGFVPMMLLTTVREWPAPPDEIPALLRGIASCLFQALKSGRWMTLRSFTGSSHIPYLVNKVTQQTGRPHYPELATLIGAAYDRPDYSEADLKMYVRRNKPRQRSR